jgi:molybdate transport system substrate-binding protein
MMYYGLLFLVGFINEVTMTRYMPKHTSILRTCAGTALGILVTASMAHAGTVTLAVTPGVVDEVETVAQAFEAANRDAHVRIIVSAEAELKSHAKRLPVQLIVSDDQAFIEWLKTRGMANPLVSGPIVSVPLALIGSSSSAIEFLSLHDLRTRLLQPGITIAIPDPQRHDCGRRALALLTNLKVSNELSRHVVIGKHVDDVLSLVRAGTAHFGLVFEPDAVTANDVVIHAVSTPIVSTPVHIFAVMSGHQNHAVAQRFLAFVSSSAGEHVLKGRGYELVENMNSLR